MDSKNDVYYKVNKAGIFEAWISAKTHSSSDVLPILVKVNPPLIDLTFTNSAPDFTI